MRLVEQQGAQATRRITDSLEEQAWLEDFLETSQPDLPDAQVPGVNYVGGSRQLRRRVTPGPPPAMAGGGDSEK